MKRIITILAFAFSFCVLSAQASTVVGSPSTMSTGSHSTFHPATTAGKPQTSQVMLAGKEFSAGGTVSMAKCDSDCSLKGGMCICSKPKGGCSGDCNETQDGKCRCPQNKEIMGGRGIAPPQVQGPGLR